jgi:hypothetical protein
MTTLEKIQRAVTTRNKVRVTRSYPGEPLCNGFILGVSETWALVQQFHDFSPEGYTTLRLGDISKCRSGKTERVFESILAGEGTLEQVGISYQIDLTSTRAILESLHSFGRNVIVECEHRKNPDADEFYIGQIVKIDKNQLWFVCFDVRGQWDTEGIRIPIAGITKIQFDTPYVNTFSKYLTPLRPRLHD